MAAFFGKSETVEVLATAVATVDVIDRVSYSSNIVETV